MKIRKDDHAEQPSTLCFQRDELAPYQYFETFVRKVPFSPEKSLQLALLRRCHPYFPRETVRKRCKKQKFVPRSRTMDMERRRRGMLFFCERLRGIKCRAVLPEAPATALEKRLDCQAAWKIEGRRSDVANPRFGQ
jgi:hypothetical protein